MKKCIALLLTGVMLLGLLSGCNTYQMTAPPAPEAPQTRQMESAPTSPWPTMVW